MSVNRIDNPAQYLIDTGLLFHINQQILHPLGLALEVNPSEGTISGIWDYRDDPEGMLYDDSIIPIGEAKFEKFMNEFGTKKHRTREDVVGFVVQTSETIKQNQGE